jgi:hypothetical protein
MISAAHAAKPYGRPESGRTPGAERETTRAPTIPHPSRPPLTVVSAAHLSISQQALLLAGGARPMLLFLAAPDGGRSRCWCATGRNIAGGGTPDGRGGRLWRRARPAGLPGCSGRLAGQFPPRLPRSQSQRPTVCRALSIATSPCATAQRRNAQATNTQRGRGLIIRCTAVPSRCALERLIIQNVKFGITESCLGPTC